ncbi:MAG TPA: sulfotransferase [Gemmatimonadota bacterium]|jgi:hypothetical protein|nr:sulfotransferase [Gemmatimonadota bacterium]
MKGWPASLVGRGGWLDLKWQYLSATGPARRNRERYSEVESYCMFIGTPRSGHSLVGAFLDAHPDAVVAHEQNALKYIQAGFDRERLFHLLLENSRASAREGRMEGAYSYSVPGQWQGRHRRLRVIGDKKGGSSSRLLARYPDLLERLRNTVRVPLRVIHVVRNPFDNIATMALHSARGRAVDLPVDADHYFERCEVVARIEGDLAPGELYRTTHEEFLADPRAGLEGLLRWLGLDPESGLVQACVATVRTRPHQSRQKVDWPPEVLRDVERRIGDCPFLTGYSFEE